ncbi:hypothetical protein PRIPAC_84358 [Pristionchus pacificus]|uniref:Uncharacterized protein n=1 Tax=Pristionchus pacificus TaxID=54126 RepID=A0A2A6BS57_PRIPA|nr:hypothetical protein PRIPAC_84358 [Pristionchus pacificus]|eukprot:PDM68591.1 hypothetical protein PRIPAC_46893 [Pristionchus pacificus]
MRTGNSMPWGLEAVIAREKIGVMKAKERKRNNSKRQSRSPSYAQVSDTKMEDEEFSMYENRFGSRDLSLQAAAAAESLNSTSFLDQIDDGIGELRDWAEQLERNPSSSRVFDVDKTGLGVRAAYVHPSSASSSLIDQSDDDMGGRQSTTLWNADNPSSSRVFDVDKTGLGARAAHIHLSSTRSSAAIHGMEEDDSGEKEEENEGGRGGDQGSVFLDDSGKYFYHRPLESCIMVFFYQVK